MGQTPHRYNILSVSNANPCVVQTAEEHDYISGDFVRITDLNGFMPDPRGVDPINNYRFRIVKLSDDTFKIQNPITHIDVNSTNYTPYVEGGSVNLVETEFFYHGDDE